MQLAAGWSRVLGQSCFWAVVDWPLNIQGNFLVGEGPRRMVVARGRYWSPSDFAGGSSIQLVLPIHHQLEVTKSPFGGIISLFVIDDVCLCSLQNVTYLLIPCLSIWPYLSSPFPQNKHT